MESISNIYKQFGFVYVLKAVIKKSLTNIFKSSVFIIMAIEDHKPTRLSSSVMLFDKTNISELYNSYSKIPNDLDRQINKFISKSSLILYNSNEKIIGWGFVQTEGVSLYGGYQYELPETFALFRNLIVDPKYRGKSIGKIINRARLDIIPADSIPLGFVVNDNRYAIRNLKMLGFEKIMTVRNTVWLGRFHYRNFKILKNAPIAETIKTGFKQ